MVLSVKSTLILYNFHEKKSARFAYDTPVSDTRPLGLLFLSEMIGLLLSGASLLSSFVWQIAPSGKYYNLSNTTLKCVKKK